MEERVEESQAESYQVDYESLHPRAALEARRVHLDV